MCFVDVEEAGECVKTIGEELRVNLNLISVDE